MSNMSRDNPKSATLTIMSLSNLRHEQGNVRAGHNLKVAGGGGGEQTASQDEGGIRKEQTTHRTREQKGQTV